MKLYVPNPQMWVDFFERVNSGKASLNQTGAGRRAHVIAVDQSKASEDLRYPIEAVLPAEQTTARAKSELERKDINPASIARMVQSTARGAKRRRKNEDIFEIKRDVGVQRRTV